LPLVSSDDLQKRIDRLGKRLLDEVEAWDARKHPADGAARAATPLTRAEEKATRRSERRAQKRLEEAESASVAGGLVYLAVALLCAGYALLNPRMWWLLFVALGLGTTGARQMALAHRRDRALGPAVTAAPVAVALPPAVSNEIDALCDQLLADLKNSPEAVRAFVVSPEQTIESLRTTCHALAARRQQLAADRALERITDVERQKRDLTLRRDAAGDEMAKQKLSEALQSLDAQVGALRQLAAAHERVDGEYTSLLVTLQELRTRVTLAKSVGASGQLDGLKQSVSRLNSELEAITEALEAAPSPQAVVPVTSDEGSAAERGERVQ